MADVEFELSEDGRSAVVTTEKSLAKYTISKSKDGFIFYEILQDKGALPDKLSGRWSSIDAAYKGIKEYLGTVKESTGARRERVGKEVRERLKKNGSETSGESGKQLRKGANN